MTARPAGAPPATTITGTGLCVPGQTLASRAVERRLGLAEGTVFATLGVRERRITPPDQAVSDLAVAAAAEALQAAGDPPVGLVVLATSTPDHPVPATAPQVAHRLGLRCPAFDLMNTCSGWMYGLGVADRWLRAGSLGADADTPGGGAALVIGANVLSRRLDWDEWSTSGLFGDGAGAVVLRPHDGPGGLHAVRLDADGRDWRKIMVPAGGSRMPVTVDRVQAKEHLLRIERRSGMMEDSLSLLLPQAQAALSAAGWSAGDVDLFVPHQANARLVAAAAERLDIPADRTASHIDRYGNTSAASIPIALAEAVRSGRLRPGHRVLAAVVAGGMTAGAACMEWT